MRCPHQRHVPTEGPSCSYNAWPKYSSAAAHIRSLRTSAARFETKLVWSSAQRAKVLMHPLVKRKRRQPVLPHCSGHKGASTTLDPDDYELFEESYDPDDYEPLDDAPAEGPLGGAAATKERGRLHSILGPALALLRFAPVETAKAVHITVAGTASMVGEALHQTTSTLSAATEESVQQIARRTHTEKVVKSTRQRWRKATADVPKDPWGRLVWLWDRPPVKRVRLTISMAQWSVRLPALLALIATQIGLVASQFSLPMLAPLLFGTGILLRSIRTNASLIFPRIGVVVVLLWMLWFFNSVVQNTVVYLRRQGGLDHRVSGAIITSSECTALLAAFVIVLSMLGVNVNALLLPAGIALAYAAKDLSHNFLAGFFLFAVQPFKLGDRVAVSYSTPASGGRAPWFEGVCEKVDLRYTIVKNGPRRLFVPNSAFLTREFMVVDDPTNKSRRDLGANEAEFGIFGQPPPPDGAAWRSNVQHFNGSRAPGEMAAQQHQQQEQMAREQYAQYAPAKTGSHTGHSAQPGSPAPLQPSDMQQPGGQQAEPAPASAPRRGAGDSPRQAAGAPPEQQYRQPAGYTRAGQPYYYSHEAMSQHFLGYPGGAGHMHPSVYNPYL